MTNKEEVEEIKRKVQREERIASIKKFIDDAAKSDLKKFLKDNPEITDTLNKQASLNAYDKFMKKKRVTEGLPEHDGDEQEKHEDKWVDQMFDAIEGQKGTINWRK